MTLHIYPVTIRDISPPIHCLLSRPTTEFRSLPTLIYFHGLNGTRNQIFQERYKAFAEAIQQLNCNLLAVDLRCHGERRESKDVPAVENMMKVIHDPQKNPFDGSIADIRRITQFLIDKSIAPAGEMAVAGMSWGGLHAMYALQHERSILCGVVLLPVGRLASMVEFRPLKNEEVLRKYEPMNYLRQIAPKPLLMIPAEQDNRVTPFYASQLFLQLRSHYQDADAENHLAYRMLLGVRHAYDSRMTQMAVDWLNKHFLTENLKSKVTTREKPKGL